MPPPSFLVGSVVLDHGEDSLAGGAPERFGQIAADVVFLDLEHPNEARRGAPPRLLPQGAPTAEGAGPQLPAERPRSLARGPAGPGGNALRHPRPPVA